MLGGYTPRSFSIKWQREKVNKKAKESNRTLSHLLTLSQHCCILYSQTKRSVERKHNEQRCNDKDDMRLVDGCGIADSPKSLLLRPDPHPLKQK